MTGRERKKSVLTGAGAGRQKTDANLQAITKRKNEMNKTVFSGLSK